MNSISESQAFYSITSEPGEASTDAHRIEAGIFLILANLGLWGAVIALLRSLL